MAELLATASYGASSLLLAQSSGGNNSVKTPEHDLLWVKASGVRLGEITQHTGFVAVQCSSLRRIADAPSSQSADRRAQHEDAVVRIQAAALQGSEGRPSLEAPLHALFPQQVVLHLHPVYVNAFACLDGGRDLLSETIGSRFLWANYAAPGREIAAEVASVLSEEKNQAECNAMVLANHGFVAAGKSAKEVIALTELYIAAGEKAFGKIGSELLQTSTPSQELVQASQAIAKRVAEVQPAEQFTVRPARHYTFTAFCRNARYSATPGPMVPDDVVYTGNGVKLESLDQSLNGIVANLQEKKAFALEGIGTVLMARNPSLVDAMEETLLAHMLTRILIARRGTPHPLPQQEIDYLQNMESEKYRIALMSKGK